MRIIVTNAGMNFMKDEVHYKKDPLNETHLKNEDSMFKNPATANSHKSIVLADNFSSHFKTNNETETEKKTHKKCNSNIDNKYYNTVTESSNTFTYNTKRKDCKTLNGDIKMLNINQTKYRFPRSLLERYNNQRIENLDIQSSILPTLPSSIQVNSTKREKSGILKTKFSLKEIIQPKIIKDLEQKTKNEKIIKEEVQSFDQNNFRTNYQQKSISTSINKNLGKEISQHNINLIKYIKSKKSISEVLLTQLAQSDEDRMNKIDKICHIKESQKEMEKLNYSRLKDKILDKENLEKKDYIAKIQNMKNEVTEYKNLVERYENDNVKNISLKKQRVKELWKIMKKEYWDKNNIDKLIRGKRNDNISTSD